jgi:hypothetical protein
MTILRYLYIVLMVSPLVLLGQVKLYPEQIALYHLDTLIKIDPAYAKVNYKTDGRLIDSQTDSMDAFLLTDKKSAYNLKLPFSDFKIVEDKSLVSFEVNSKPKNKKESLIRISHHVKVENVYYVFLSLSVSRYTGYLIKLAINEQGILVNHAISTYGI